MDIDAVAAIFKNKAVHQPKMTAIPPTSETSMPGIAPLTMSMPPCPMPISVDVEQLPSTEAVVPTVSGVAVDDRFDPEVIPVRDPMPIDHIDLTEKLLDFQKAENPEDLSNELDSSDLSEFTQSLEMVLPIGMQLS